MISLRKFFLRHAVLFVVLFSVAVLPFMFCVSWLLNLVQPSFAQQLFSHAVHIAWPIGLAVFFGYGFAFKSNRFMKAMKPGLAYFVFYVFAVLLNILLALTEPETVWKSPENLLLGVVMMIGVGIREEVLFRGIVTNTLGLKYARSPKGVWFTVLLSGVLFGVVHMYNMFSGTSLSGALVQTVGAAAVGILFSAVYLRSGNLWVVILIHAVVDGAALFKSAFLANTVTTIDQINDLSLNTLLIVVPLNLLLAAFLLRKKKLPAILERVEALRSELNC